MGIAWALVIGFAAGALGVLLAKVVAPAMTGRSETSLAELLACVVVAGAIVGASVGIGRRRRFKRRF